MSLSKPRKMFLLVALPVFLVVFGLFALRTFLWPKIYASTAQVELNGFTTNAPAVPLLSAQAKIMQSEAVLNPVADRLNLETVWGKKLKLDATMNRWETLGLLRRQLEILPAAEANVLQIRFYDDDKFEAPRVANTIAEVYCLLTTNNAAAIIKPRLRARAVVGEHPVKPNRPLSLLLSGLGALAAALALGGFAGWISASLEAAARRPSLPESERP